jgi:hypothetical protein
MVDFRFTIPVHPLETGKEKGPPSFPGDPVFGAASGRPVVSYNYW